MILILLILNQNSGGAGPGYCCHVTCNTCTGYGFLSSQCLSCTGIRYLNIALAPTTCNLTCPLLYYGIILHYLHYVFIIISVFFQNFIIYKIIIIIFVINN